MKTKTNEMRESTGLAAQESAISKDVRVLLIRAYFPTGSYWSIELVRQWGKDRRMAMAWFRRTPELWEVVFIAR